MLFDIEILGEDGVVQKTYWVGHVMGNLSKLEIYGVCDSVLPLYQVKVLEFSSRTIKVTGYTNESPSGIPPNYKIQTWVLYGSQD
jgi:hypothetical protein